MAGESCSINRKLNSDPEVYSALFPKIVELLKGIEGLQLSRGKTLREEAIEIYKVLVGKKFMSQYKQYLKVDQSNTLKEPTFESILSIPQHLLNLLIQVDGKTENLFSRDRRMSLVKDRYSEVLENAFNLEDIITDDGLSSDKDLLECFEHKLEILNEANRAAKGGGLIYVPSLSQGKVVFTLENLNTENERKVEQFFREYTTVTHALIWLNSNGININLTDLLTNYSLADIDTGLKHIININLENQTITDLTTSMQAIIGSILLNSLDREKRNWKKIWLEKQGTLVTRLLDQLDSPEVQRRILGEELYNTAEDPLHLSAAILVGEAYTNRLSENSIVSNFNALFTRIMSGLKYIWSKITKSKYTEYQSKAEKLSESLARKFPKSKAYRKISIRKKILPIINSLDILPKEQIGKIGEKSAIKILYERVTTEINNFLREVKSIDSSLFEEFSELHKVLHLDPSYSKDDITSKIAQINSVNEAIRMLILQAEDHRNALAGLDLEDLAKDPSPERLAFFSKRVRMVGSFLANIENVYMCAQTVLPNIKENSETFQTLKSNLEILKNIHGVLKASYYTNSFGAFSFFLSEVYGSATINRGARLVFRSWGLHQEAAAEISIDTYLETLQEDESFFSRWLASMSNSNDVINQLADRAVKIATDNANSEVRRYWDQLLDLSYRFKADEIDQRRFFSVDKDGNLTGCYVTEDGLNWGSWESDFEEFKSECSKEFYKKYKSFSSDSERISLWDDYFRDRYKSWHKEHSIYDEEEEIWKPNESYKSSQYEMLSDLEKKYLAEILEIKESLDEKLSYINLNGEVVYCSNVARFRAPQFRGSTNNRIENIKNSVGLGSATWSVTRDLISEAFLETSEDTDFGSENTINSDDDPLAYKNTFEFRSRVQRLNTYGINRLSSIDQMTTDVFSGLLQYSVMACNYEAMNTIVDILEVGSDVLSRRNVEGKAEKNRPEGLSRAHARYRDYLNAQVYGIHGKKVTVGKVVVNKILELVAKIARVKYLGWNIPGGVINLMNGVAEIFKEAAAGQFMNMKSYRKAHSLYLGNMAKNWMESGLEHKNNKLSLFMREFDSQGDFRLHTSQFSSRRVRAWNMAPIGNNYLWPYKLGDHYMQAISYLAIANDTDKFAFVNTKDLTDSTIYSLYDAMEVVPINPKNPKGPQTIRIKEGFKLKIKGSDGTRDFSEKDRADFMMMCREVNNRMHGVYNAADKTALHQDMYGSLLLAMKGYALGYIERRFRGVKTSIALQSETEGSYYTLAKCLYATLFGSNIITSDGRERYKWNPTGMLLGIINPYSSWSIKYLKDMGFQDYQIANMRRNQWDFLYILLTNIAKNLTEPPEEEDFISPEAYKRYKEDNKALAMLHYTMVRLYNEQAAFSIGIQSEAASLLSIMPPGASALFELSAMAPQLAVDIANRDEYEDGERWKSADMYLKMSPFGKNYRFYEDPWKAADNYEYIRHSNR